MTARAPVTAIVTAYDRIPRTLETLRVILAAEPAPAEVLVHVDGNRSECADAIRAAFPGVSVTLNPGHVGPGGGRSRLIADASQPYIASFDDDSFPVDADYFGRVVAAFERNPQAWILAARVFNRGEAVEAAGEGTESDSANFVGCGCAYRKAKLAGMAPYVPLPMAFGMEEVDLAMRVVDRGGAIAFAPSLRVRHDTDFSHHQTPFVTAHAIANAALLAFLRYPARYWPLGLAQVLNRILWSVRHGRGRGILTGILAIPRHLWRHRAYRDTVSPGGLRRYRTLRSR